MKELDTLLVHPIDTVMLTQLVVVQEKKDLLWNLFSYDAVSVAVPVILFMLGYLLSGIYRWTVSKRENFREKEIFKYHLHKVFEKFVPQLIEAYTKTNDSISVVDGMALTPPKVFSADFVRLLKMDSPELYKRFNDHSNLSQVLTLAHFIGEIMQHVDSFYTMVRASNDELRTRLSQQLNGDEANKGYMSSINEYLIQAEQQGTSHGDPSYDFLAEKMKLYHEQLKDVGAIDMIYTDVVRKIQEHLIETKLYKSNQIASDIAERGRLVSYSYTRLFKETDEIKSELIKFIEMYRETMDKYKKVDQNFMKPTYWESLIGTVWR